MLRLKITYLNVNSIFKKGLKKALNRTENKLN